MSNASGVGARPAAPGLSFGAVLRCALLGGAAGGIIAALVNLLLVQRSIRAALAIEERLRPAGHDHADEVFGRGTQVIGGMIAAVLAGLVLGVVFAIAFAWLRHRLPGAGDFERAVWLAAAGFVVVSLLPAIKYPANPPAVGDPATVDARTTYFLTFILATILVTAAVGTVADRFPGGWPAPVSRTATAVLLVACYGGLLAVWPGSPDPVPAAVPAELIWQFRLDSLAGLAGLWFGLGIVCGLTMEHRGRTRRA